MLRRVRVILVTFVVSTIGAELCVAQPSRPVLRLISASAGPQGTATGDRFVFSEERSTFSRTEDKELVVYFQWEGSPGHHRMVANLRSPDNSLSSSSAVEYVAKNRQFGAYWRFPLSSTMPLGTWVVEVTVDGEPAGRLPIDIRGESAPDVPPKRVLPQAKLYETLNAIYVVLQRTTSAGRQLEHAGAVIASPGRLYTVISALDEAERIQAFQASATSRPVTELLGWSRSERWAVLAAETGSTLPIAAADPVDTVVGDRCFSIDGTADGGRVLLEGTITGRTGGAQPRLIVGFYSGLARPGAPVINESGELLGVVDGPTGLFELIKAQGELRGSAIVPFAAFRVTENARPITLAEMRARGDLLPAVIGDEHIVSGGFAAAINKGPIVAPTDQRTEFSVSDKTLTVFVTFSPQARLRGMMSLKLFTAENKHLSQTIPKKTDLRKQNLVLTSWQMPMLQIPGVYRADVMLDDRTLWRGYVRITP